MIGGRSGRRRITTWLCATAVAGVGMLVSPVGTQQAVAQVLFPTTSRAGAVGPDTAGRAATVTESRVIGYSVQGRKIKAVRYGPATATRVAVVIGQMHGNETGGIPITKRLSELGAPADTAMWIIRTLSPDALKSHQRVNTHGVDINRNGSDLWAGTARAPDYYPGPYSMSEPETNAYVAFLDSVDPDVVLIYHQHGNGVDSYQVKNIALLNGLASRMRLPVKSFDCDGECTGTLTGWFNKTHQGAAITIELPATVTNSAVKRWTRAAQWAVSSG